LLLFAHFHRLFDARLFAIHPKTHVIPTFMPSDDILPFHGLKVHFNPESPPDSLAL